MPSPHAEHAHDRSREEPRPRATAELPATFRKGVIGERRRYADLARWVAEEGGSAPAALGYEPSRA
ncbi:MAG: hypothetical protein KIS87_14395 [Phycisphaeraceae bacterium]|nr:hypothetical protein [Phycisphaeraceae bacterium]